MPTRNTRSEECKDSSHRTRTERRVLPRKPHVLHDALAFCLAARGLLFCIGVGEDERPLIVILALNETRKTLLASRLHVLEKRAIEGSEYPEDIRPGDGVWLEPSEDVDTRRLRAPIDLVFVDATHRVLAVVDLIRARSERTVIPGAVAILALASGTIRLSQTREGDHIVLDPIAPPVGVDLPAARAPRC